jgi:hypothetical protein
MDGLRVGKGEVASGLVARGLVLFYGMLFGTSQVCNLDLQFRL